MTIKFGAKRGIEPTAHHGGNQSSQKHFALSAPIKFPGTVWVWQSGKRINMLEQTVSQTLEHHTEAPASIQDLGAHRR